jgi:glyoxylase-like metal-dependent hydrolase (beta-lactamase superfamily II)
LTDPRDFPGGTATRILNLRVETTIVDRLGDPGITAADLQGVFMTHLHHDHAGGIEDLPVSAPPWVTEREWFAASAGSRLKGYDDSPFADHPPRSLDFSES